MKSVNAMSFESVNTKYLKSVYMLIAVFGLLVLSGCASKMQLPAAGQKVALKPTEQFIPKQAYDEKTGQPVAYVEKENPYLAIKSRVAKGSVLLFIEAKKAMRAENYSVAKQKLQVITRNDKDLSGPWVLLGEIAQEEKQLEQSETYYKTAISVNPKNINAYTGLAKTQRLMGEFNVAQNTLALALEIWPDFPEAHLNIAVLYDVYLNKAELAQKHMESYLFLNGYKDMQAIGWMNEIRQRTGINDSFVDHKTNVTEIIAQAVDES